MAGNYTSNGNLSLIDGVNIRTYGFIERATGFLDQPGRKKTLEHSWPDEHGLDIDLNTIVYDERRCQLEIIAKGSTFSGLVSAVNTIKAMFNKSGYRYLKLYGINGVYLVFVSGSIGVSRLNRGVTSTQYARLTIPLVEPYPVKYMYYVNNTSTPVTAALTIATSGPVTVDWGDNTFSTLTTSGTVTHTYSVNGEYCICIYGSVQSVTGITPTNCTVIYGPGGEGPETSGGTADSTTVTVDDTTITADSTI